MEDLLPNPCRSVEELDRFCQCVEEDKALKTKLYNYLKTIGGSSTGSTVRAVLRRIATHMVWSQFSAKDKSKKKADIRQLAIWKPILLSLPVLYLFLYGKPYRTGFFCDDASLSYPSTPDTVSTPVLVASGFILSVLLVVAVEVLNSLDNKCRRPCRQASDIIYCVKSYIVFMIGFLVQELVVDVVKNKMGVLRPNFFDVCKPQFNRTSCPGYISEYTCAGSEDDKELRNSRQSFPSGHSAFSMYIATYFCIYIQSLLQIRFSRLLKFFLQSGLILIAILCGLGRIKDNKHHPSDVIAGYILGIAVAIFVNVLVGMKYVKISTVTDNITLQMLDKSHGCCCTYKESSVLEPNTPAPLFQNEYSRNSSSAKLMTLQNNDGNMFVPVTSETV